MQINADYKMYTYFMTLNTYFTETILMSFVLTLVYNCAIYVSLPKRHIKPKQTVVGHYTVCQSGYLFYLFYLVGSLWSE